jgi:predicted secreted hydrolase
MKRLAPFILMIAMGGQLAAQDWKLALPGWEYRFPADHAVHPDFKTEWWYFTGNLEDKATGRAFGYELTFFRQGVLPPCKLPPAGERSRFVQSDFKFAHFAISDLKGQKFNYAQKTTRGAFGEAGFGPAPGAALPGGEQRLVWLDDWNLTPLPDGSWQITARAKATAGMAINLNVKPVKGPVIEGTGGVSQKSAGVGNASHYYSFTRLQTVGTLSLDTIKGGAALAVSGESWFDHEWASNQLAADQIGWNWFCLQFDDGTELMLYAMRKRDGGIDPVSSGTWIDANGNSEHLRREDFQLRPLKTWRSAATGAVYPVSWQIGIPARQMEFTIRTRLDNQELVVPPISYWEGAIQAAGRRAGREITGRGYMELTGYAGELTGLKQQTGPEADLRRSTR